MGEIRIISGTYKGKLIKTPEGRVTRPLLSRLRKSLADFLRPRLPGARVLELFGGSGAITFELISNGAKEAVIVEIDRIAAAAIRGNVIRLEAPVKLYEGDCLELIVSFATKGEKFDVIINAPPYNLGLQAKAMEQLCGLPLLKEGGIIITQRDKREPLWTPPANKPIKYVNTRTYGKTIFDIYERGER
jgi:16S rRNA (guanine966-N2)-methyltransferase